MGAYDNPKIIRDTSGQIYGQAIANLGQQIGAGLTKHFDKVEAEKEKAEKEIQRQQRIAYAVEDKMYADANKNYSKLAAKDSSLVDKFKGKVEWLLKGDENSMGALKAATLLATKTDLTSEERNMYRGIVQEAQAFQISAIEGGGKIIADLEDQSNIDPSDIASTHAWAGRPGVEADTSMLTSYILGGKKIDGLSGDKDLDIGENGSMIVKVNSKIKEGSTIWNDLDPATQEHLRKNNYELTWERNINKWNEGLIEEIPEKANYDSIAEQGGFISDGQGQVPKGSINPEYIVGDENSRQKYTLGDGRSLEVRYVEADRFINSDQFRQNINSKADGIVGMGNGKVTSYMRYKMLKGKFDTDEFRKKTKPQQIQEINEAITEDFKRVKLEGLIHREATAQDVRNLKALGKNIKAGEMIYVQPLTQPTEDTVSTKDQLVGASGDMLDAIYSFEDDSSTRDYFVNKEWGDKNISDATFDGNTITLTLDVGSRYIKDPDDPTKEIRAVATDEKKFNLDNEKQMDTLINEMLQGQGYTPTVRQEMKIKLKKQLKQKVADHKKKKSNEDNSFANAVFNPSEDQTNFTKYKNANKRNNQRMNFMQWKTQGRPDK